MSTSNTSAESWHDIPDTIGYEISTFARVRNWRSRSKSGKRMPYYMKGRKTRTAVMFDIQGEHFTLDQLMVKTFGEDLGDFDLDRDPQEQDRELSYYERNEIVMLEGYKPAYEVGEEFRIDPNRVRKIWDGVEC